MPVTCVHGACTRTANAKHGYCKLHARIYRVQDIRIPADDTRHAINNLLAHGWTINAISDAAGMAWDGVKPIADGTRTTVRQSTARKIAALHGHHPTTPPVWPTARRLQSMQAAGFSQDDIATGTGYDQSTLSKIIAGTKTYVDPGVAAAVSTFYEAHKGDPVRPPARAARGKPWPTPMWWDDIDDPGEQPGITHCLNCHGDKDPARASFYCDTCAKRISRAKSTERERQKRKAAR